MTKLSITKTAENEFSLSGDLSFNTITINTIDELKLRTNHPSITIHLKAVQKIDSAGVALLIEWIKFSQTHQLELFFDVIPDQLSALIKLSYLSDHKIFKTQAIKTNG
jgi:phospholipid transport system transporter-binding protein